MNNALLQRLLKGKGTYEGLMNRRKPFSAGAVTERPERKSERRSQEEERSFETKAMCRTLLKTFGMFSEERRTKSETEEKDQVTSVFTVAMLTI